MTNETIEYKGYTISIHRDDIDPGNPFDEWDTLPSTLVLTPGCGGTLHARTYGNADMDYLPELTNKQIRDNTTDILLETDTKSLLNLITKHARMYLNNYANGTEAVNEALQTFYDEQSYSDKLEFVGSVYGWSGVVTLNTSVTGYTQGAYAELLIVADEMFLNYTGATITEPEELQYVADLYAAWAYGDVYGYTITDSKGNDTELACWGFYGANHNESGLLENALPDIDCHVKEYRIELVQDIEQLQANIREARENFHTLVLDVRDQGELNRGLCELIKAEFKVYRTSVHSAINDIKIKRGELSTLQGVA